MSIIEEVACEAAEPAWKDILADLLPRQGAWSEEEYLVLTERLGDLTQVRVDGSEGTCLANENLVEDEFVMHFIASEQFLVEFLAFSNAAVDDWDLLFRESTQVNQVLR